MMFTLFVLMGGLAANAPAPAKLSIPVLLKHLGSEDAPQRARAAEQLWAEIDRALPHLQKLRNGPQGRAREEATKLVHRYYAQKVRLTVRAVCDAVPWLDMLPAGYPNRDALLAQYTAQVRCEQPESGWPTYRQATILFLTDRMADEGWDSKRVRWFVEMMVMVEQQWCVDNNYVLSLAR